VGIVIFVKPTWIFWRYDYSTKALSAIMRLKESEPLPVIIDFLRGSKNAYIFENEYQNLKHTPSEVTYHGTTGINISFNWLIRSLWNRISSQNKMSNSLAREVLFEGDKVQLTTVQKINTEKTEWKRPKTNLPNSFETLRRLRYAISKDENVPAYVIFSDAALHGNNKTYERWRIHHNWRSRKTKLDMEMPL
jgi:ATP-dependent DNA helicase RecQ